MSDLRRFRIYKCGACDDDWTIADVERVNSYKVLGGPSGWADAEAETVMVGFSRHALSGLKTYRIIIEANWFRPNVRSDRIGLDGEWSEALRAV